ncbi:hypothetical protein BDAP_001702 [Binucleata daphniae]
MELQELIRNAKNTNPELDNITSEQNQIALNNNQYGTSQNYSIPIAIKEKAQELLRNLIKQKVIQKSYALQTSPAFL